MIAAYSPLHNPQSLLGTWSPVTVTNRAARAAPQGSLGQRHLQIQHGIDILRRVGGAGGVSAFLEKNSEKPRKTKGKTRKNQRKPQRNHLNACENPGNH